MLAITLQTFLLCVHLSATNNAQLESTTSANTAYSYLDQARELYGALRYAEVVHKLELALAQPGNSVRELSEIYSLLGIVHIVLNNHGAAETAFSELLRIDPDFQLDPHSSPKILSFFKEVRAKHRAANSVTFAQQPLVRVERERLFFTVSPTTASDAEMTIVLSHRRQPAPSYTETVMQRVDGMSYVAQIPLLWSEGQSEAVVEYFVVARNFQLRVIGASGSSAQPHRQNVTRQAEPWYESGWLWGGLAAGAFVSSALVIAIVVASSNAAEPQPSSLGTHRLD